MIVLLVIGAGGVASVLTQDETPKAQITTEQSQTTYVKYHGVEGQTALDLLKKYALVETKHYDFGDLVTSVNGTPGNGPKYWSFYVNDKLAEVGAGTYVTNDADTIEWKLQ
ncbi:hypothetical protein A3F05_02400 [Candidatus Saccharibacteria bacterium RIFCSPHIGHO2_12_FULL_47_17]|nr:MAG: hypothetical protein A3F05_02400 [Candidatus Saccharibacteria bacterium RIFCSPHIGHO2_12_FULL_47_17]